MCGIGGFIFLKNCMLKEKEKEEIIIKLLVNLEKRGKDATGIALINTDSNSMHIFKKNIHASAFVCDKKFNEFLNNYLSNSNLVLLHSRAKTHGDEKSNNNNHPIFSKISNSVLVHNGIIQNDVVLKSKYNLQTDGEVDSEVILRLFEKKNTNIIKTIKKLNGSMAFALFHNKILYLYRYISPLSIAYHKNNDYIIFASEISYIQNITNNQNIYFDLFVEKSPDKNTLYYSFKDSELILFDFNTLIFKKFKVHPHKEFNDIMWRSREYRNYYGIEDLNKYPYEEWYY